MQSNNEKQQLILAADQAKTEQVRLQDQIASKQAEVDRVTLILQNKDAELDALRERIK